MQKKRQKLRFLDSKNCQNYQESVFHPEAPKRKSENEVKKQDRHGV
jgi:hypothetical protein